MTDFSRLSGYIMDYFPEPKYSKQDIRDWAYGNVPAWKYMGESDKEGILQDWENFVYKEEVEPEISRVESEIRDLLEGKGEGFLSRAISRIKAFLGRWF